MSFATALYILAGIKLTQHRGWLQVNPPLIAKDVETPQSHKTPGLVTVTSNRNGSEFDWGTTPAGSLFYIRQSEDRPDWAFLAIPYRGHWFYLADNDLESKSTFMLLMQLFRLQAGTAKSIGPTLTIPVR